MNRTEPILDDVFYHVYNRGNRRQAIFGDESDYCRFLEKLHAGCRKYNVCLAVYCLMPNHFHLLALQQPGGSLSRLMISACTAAAKRYNLKYSTDGHLLRERFRYKLVSGEDSIVTVARYIHLNPVVAGLVAQPEDWPYSDFAEWLAAEDGEKGVLLPGKNGVEGRLLPRWPCTAREYVASVHALLKASFSQVRSE